MNSARPPAPPRLLIITDRNATGGRPLPDVVAQALSGLPPLAAGAAPPVAVQLREKDLPARPLLELARALRAVTHAAGVPLFVNDRVDVALAAGADGVHLGGGSLAIDDVRALAPHLAVAVSTHTRADVDAAAAAGAAFVVFGSVFDTPKKNPGEPVAPTGLARLRDACAAAVPVLALGGLSPDRTLDCLGAGAAGVACIRSIMSARDPAAVTQMLLSCFNTPRDAF